MGIYIISLQAILQYEGGYSFVSRFIFYFFLMKLFTSLIVQIKGTITYF
jgi:hypothetical protein